MQRQVVRFVLPAVLLAAGCGAVAWTWHLAEQVNTLQRAGDRSLTRIDRLDTLLDDVAERELIYVASSDAGAETLQAVSATLQEMGGESSALVLHVLARNNPAVTAVADAATDIVEIDNRAQENLRAGLDLMAADLVFTETHAARQSMRQQIRVLRSAEAGVVADARAAALKQAWAGLGGVGLLFAVVLITWSRRPAVVVPAPLAETSTPPRAQPSYEVDLTATADLCTAIGCMKTESELQGHLERAKRVPGATGVVVWMGAGEELFPAAASGYDLKALARLGPIFRSSVNATASAWRSGAFQIVPGDDSSQSALVAPMLGPERCIGVLAIEVDPDRETDLSTRAATTVIAAQLAAVLTAWPAASLATSADVLPFDKTASASS